MSYGFVTKHREIPLEQRTREAQKQLARGDRDVYPIVMDIYGERSDVGMHRHKFAIASDATVASVLATARRHANPPMLETEALTTFSLSFDAEGAKPAQTLLCPSNTVGQVYAEHKSNDELLYVLFCVENVFGGAAKNSANRPL